MKAIKEHSIAWIVAAVLAWAASNFLTVPWASAQAFEKHVQFVEAHIIGQLRLELYRVEETIANIRASGQTVPLHLKARRDELRALIHSMERG